MAKENESTKQRYYTLLTKISNNVTTLTWYKDGLRFKCTQCGKVLEVDDTYCGKVVECPYCEKGIVVPTKPLERETTLRRRMHKNPFEDTFQVSMSSTKVTTAKRNMAKFKFDCPWCGLKTCGERTCPRCGCYLDNADIYDEDLRKVRL